MTSIPCTLNFTTPSFNFFKSNKTQPSWIPASSNPIKSSLGSSNSALFQHGFPLKPPNFSRASSNSQSQFRVYATAVTEFSIYDFTVKDLDKNDVPLSKYKGKVLLIVNVASDCCLTIVNYFDLIDLHWHYRDLGFEVLAFPCNQFDNKEPDSNAEIKQFAVKWLKAEFPVFDKVDVNGLYAIPLFRILKAKSGGEDIKNNYEKFLVDRHGNLFQRYPSTTQPISIKKDIRKLLRMKYELPA